MAKPEARSDARGDRDRPVDPGRDDAVHLLGGSEHPDGGLVLGGYDCAAIGEFKSDRGGVPVASDDEEVALVRGAKETELCRPGS
jgi:hypothetical protein